MKFPIVNLVLTVFLLWLTIQLNKDYEVYLAYFFILTVGILHGANDLSLINHVSKDSDTPQLKYLGFYVGIIVVMALGFFQFPFIALCVFVLFSCYHFGEQHFCNQLEDTSLKDKWLFISYGALIFSLLFYLNLQETISIIYELTGIQLYDHFFLVFLIVSIVMTILSIAVNYNSFNSGFAFLQEAFLILLFAVLFKLASLLWAFAIYFIIWHSVPSLKDQTLALYGQLDKTSLLQYFKSSAINWFISIIGLGIFYYVSTLMNIRFITLFFAFLAAITIPHVVVMFFLNKK